MRSTLAAVLLAVVAVLVVPLCVSHAAAQLPGGDRTVPALYGLTKARAAAHVHERGLELSATGSGKVVSQNPLPGAQVPAGSTVHVTLRSHRH
jgi:beta-lactam-binding protein with PASTA domain